MFMANNLLANARTAKPWSEHLRILNHTSAIAFENVKNRRLLVLCIRFICHVDNVYANPLVMLI